MRLATPELRAAGLSARQIADRIHHSTVSMTSDRRAVISEVADALDRTDGEETPG